MYAAALRSRWDRLSYLAASSSSSSTDIGDDSVAVFISYLSRCTSNTVDRLQTTDLIYTLHGRDARKPWPCWLAGLGRQ